MSDSIVTQHNKQQQQASSQLFELSNNSDQAIRKRKRDEQVAQLKAQGLIK